MKNDFYRYDFFTICSNGFKNIDDILQILRSEKDIKIIYIRKYIAHNVRELITKLSACDTTSPQYTISKLEYLYKLPPEVINIFVENHNPQEIMVGTPPYREKQGQYITGIKNKIRNLYNPKHNNPKFHVLPLDKGVSHEHVTHASNNEEQVDCFLNLLGYKEGISYLKKNDHGLPFDKPFYIPRPSQYSIKQSTLR